jgi:hypothetical protein
MTSISALLDRGASAGATSFGGRLRAVMHAFLANAILTAAVANAPEDIRRDLSSSNSDIRAKAEDSLVDRLVSALYDTNGESTSSAG